MFLGAATLSTLHIGISGSFHIVEEIILQDTVRSVSYTHLDVYKRQPLTASPARLKYSEGVFLESLFP